ncbi:MAG: hypothetical protein WDZ41_02210 [Candidatus Babeliales bacterium]
MNKYTLILLLLMISFSNISMHGMESPSPKKPSVTKKEIFTSPDKTTIFFTNHENDGGMLYVLKSLEKTSEGDLIFMHDFYLTDTRLKKLLMKKKSEGVVVKIILNQPTNKSTPTEMKELGITLFNGPLTTENKKQQLHTKNIGWTYFDQAKEERQFRFYNGSRNFTYASHQPGYYDKNANKEAMIYHIDQDTFEQHLETHNKIENIARSQKNAVKTPKKDSVDLVNKFTLDVTPEKSTSISSLDYDITTSVAQRLDKKADYWINLYAINDENMKNKIKDLAEKGFLNHLQIDGHNLRNEATQDFLLMLQDKYNIPIYVYNPDQKLKCGRFPVANHIKAFVRREPNNKWLLGVGSANFTNENNLDINDWGFYPEEALSKNTLRAFEEIKHDSVLLNEALDQFARAQEIKTQKRKNDKPPTKKVVKKRLMFNNNNLPKPFQQVSLHSEEFFRNNITKLARLIEDDKDRNLGVLKKEQYNLYNNALKNTLKTAKQTLPSDAYEKISQQYNEIKKLI